MARTRSKIGAEVVSPETLRSELEQGQQLSYYLLIGDEEFERDELAEWLIDELQPDAAPDFNIDVFHGDNLEPERVLECYYSYPMLASHRLVVLRKCDKMSADQCKRLDPVVSEIQETSVLIAVGSKVDMRRRLFQQMGKAGRRLEFKAPYQNQVPRWLVRHARNRGLEIEPAAADLLALYIGTNTLELSSELEKLSIYVGFGNVITAQSVMALVGVSNATSVFELADTVGQQNYDKAQKMLHTMLAQGEEPLRILAMLTRHLQLLSRAGDFQGQSLSSADMAQRLGVSSYFLKNYLEQARRFSGDQLWAGLSVLLEADRLLKSRRRSQHATILQLQLTKLCSL